MILLIDTSAKEAVISTLGDHGEGAGEEQRLSARSPELIPALRRMAAENRITKVLVVTGPGSFTGLRVGVAFGLGLARGLGVPIVPLPTLALQAARSDDPVTAVVEAGRGRYYFLLPGMSADLGEPAEIQRTHRLVGRVSAEGRSALEASGHVFQPETRLRSTGEAALRLLETAKEVAYGSLKIDYMQTFSTRA